MKNRSLYILLKTYWEGEISRSDIVQKYDVSPVQASKDLAEIKTNYPLAIRYNPSVKRYEPDVDIQAFLPKKNFLLYRQTVLDETSNHLINVLPATPQIDVFTYRILHKAIKNGHGLSFLYHSLNSSKKNTPRVVYPHSLINTGHRWHLRGWEKESDTFKDFNIPRIIKSSISLINFKEEKSDKQFDTNWNQKTTLFLIPNPQLTDYQKEIVALDFNMKHSILTISIPKALALYTLHSYQIMDFSSTPPKTQLLAIANPESLSEWQKNS